MSLALSRPDSDLLARVSDFLVAEAELLDDRLLDTWFALFERAALQELHQCKWDNEDRGYSFGFEKLRVAGWHHHVRFGNDDGTCLGGRWNEPIERRHIEVQRCMVRKAVIAMEAVMLRRPLSIDNTAAMAVHDTFRSTRRA